MLYLESALFISKYEVVGPNVAFSAVFDAKNARKGGSPWG
jgi:hypothetical protein